MDTVDWRKQVRFGLIGMLTIVFIALAGMPVVLDRRNIIEPALSMGYLSLLWVPLVFANIAGNEVLLEGMKARQRSYKDLIAGCSVGLVSSAGLTILMVLVQNFDLRDPLVNWSPQLLDLLSFRRTQVTGMIFWLALGAALGTLGGAMHMVSRRARLLIFSVSLSVFSVSVLETFLADLLEGFGLEVFTDFIYYKRGGLEISGAVLVAILALVIPLVAGGRLKKVKTRIVELPKEERKKVNLLMLFTSAGL